MIAMSVVKLPKMTDKEIEDLIEEQKLCRIAFKARKYPYMAPFRYVTLNGVLYFHFTDYGKKMRLISKDNRVCVEVESYSHDLSEYNFVVMRGELEVVSDEKERDKAILKMAEEGRRNLSENFLAAHGFEKEEGWSGFTPDKKMVIVKLKDISEIVALKSP
jgi:nitroimidazol reductase NimA-like FMN-containing flavoprotein (pyridoxamine 5'-phosphate oxidase superfamily)